MSLERVLIIEEDDDLYSVIALRLPGVQSQGETIEEAKTNIAEALNGALRVYSESSIPVPWSPVDVEDASLGVVAEVRVTSHPDQRRSR